MQQLHTMYNDKQRKRKAAAEGRRQMQAPITSLNPSPNALPPTPHP